MPTFHLATSSKFFAGNTDLFIKTTLDAFKLHWTTWSHSFHSNSSQSRFLLWEEKIPLTNQLRIGYFQVPKTLTFKASLSGNSLSSEKEFYLHKNKKKFTSTASHWTSLETVSAFGQLRNGLSQLIHKITKLICAQLVMLF